jgi:hypothetical protein
VPKRTELIDLRERVTVRGARSADANYVLKQPDVGSSSDVWLVTEATAHSGAPFGQATWNVQAKTTLGRS